MYIIKKVTSNLLDTSNYDDLLANALSLSTTQSTDLDDELLVHPVLASFKSPIKSYVHIYRGGFCGRGNTSASYNELNRYVSLLIDQQDS